MVDVGHKPDQHRIAVVSGRIEMRAQTLARVQSQSGPKGDVLGVARVAGIMASKRTADLVPLCHPIPLTRVVITFDCVDTPAPAVCCTVRAETRAPTGVEMEALIACQTALATIYDMCKAADRGMVIQAVQLEEKAGGRSGHWQRIGPSDNPA